MIKINIINNENTFNQVNVSGHAVSNKKDNPLVCSAITAIITGMFNAIDQMVSADEVNLKIQSGWSSIQVIKLSKTLDIMIKTLIYQLKTMYEQYPEFIDLKENSHVKV